VAIPEDEDVEKTLTRLMSQNSPLQKQARTQGLQSAQQMGLGQSTMGIKAAQASAYNAALPIASQQTAQAHQRGLQGEQFTHQRGMQEAQFGQQDKTLAGQYGHETGMQERGFGHAASQAEMDRRQQQQMLLESAYLDRLKMHEGSSLTRAEMAQQQAHEANMRGLDRSTQERIAAMEISAADRDRAAGAFMAAENSYAALFSQIGANENLPADVRDRYLTHAGNIRNSNFNMLSSLYRASGQIPW
jgi:hypothetical protein